MNCDDLMTKNERIVWDALYELLGELHFDSGVIDVRDSDLHEELTFEMFKELMFMIKREL